MKQDLMLLIVGIFMSVTISAQEVDSPTEVTKAAFFDKSIPLRDQPMIQMKAGNSRTKPLDYNNWFKDRPTGNEHLITDEESIQNKQGEKKTKGPIVNVNGTGNVNGVYPPDTDGDVSPDHFVQMINLSFAVYDKNGTKLYGPVANSTLWAGFPGPWTGTNDGDPIIFWDDLSERWVASQFAVNTSNGTDYELLAVSETSDPLGSWYRYAFEFSMFPDYPKISAWTDGYYATFHMFQGSFQGTAFVVFEKEKMLVGDQDAQMIYFGPYGSRWAFLPADCDGVAPPAGQPCNFTGINFWGNQYMQIFELTPNWANPNSSTIVVAGNFPTTTFSSSVSGIPQPGTNTQLDAFSTNLMYRLPYRNFGTHQSMVANHAVNISGHTGIRWYEIRDEGSGWYIYQTGTYSPDNNNRWMGSMAISANGNIALGYSVSSGSVYPSLRYTGRTPSDPLGQMSIAEVELVAGLSSQSGINRWGDYASMTADPVEPDVFWFTSEYMKAGGNWGTRIGSFDFEALQQPEVFAGNDTLICEDVLFETTAYGLYYTSVQWESSGDGFFQNSTSINAKYLRGNGDIANGGVTLSVTAFGFETGWETTDEVYVSIITSPEANAGSDTTIHMNHMAYLHGQAGDYSTVLWTSNGDGAFANATALVTTYTPGAGDISAGQVQLTLTAQAMEPCSGQDADNVTVFVDPTVGIGQSRYTDNLVKIIPNPSDGRFTVQITGMNNADNYTISMLDYTGRIVLSEYYNSDQLFNKVFDFSAYPKGIYFMEISNEKYNAMEKIIVK